MRFGVSRITVRRTIQNLVSRGPRRGVVGNSQINKTRNLVSWNPNGRGNATWKSLKIEGGTPQLVAFAARVGVPSYLVPHFQRTLIRATQRQIFQESHLLRRCFPSQLRERNFRHPRSSMYLDSVATRCDSSHCVVHKVWSSVNLLQCLAG
jgi:hypothetical protein